MYIYTYNLLCVFKHDSFLESNISLLNKQGQMKVPLPFPSLPFPSLPFPSPLSILDKWHTEWK